MMPYNREIVIGMPPGIGDLHWIMAKLESFKEKNNIEKVKIRMNLGCTESKSFHDCSLDYLSLLPFVDSTESVMEVIPFEYALAGGSGTTLFKNHGGCDYMIEFNSQLEAGVKLENILPEYDTNFDYPVAEPPEAKEFAAKIKADVGGKLVLIFTGGVPGNDIWARELWTPHDWVELARKTHTATGCRPVVIGARWDKSYSEKMEALEKEKIMYDIVGKTSVADLFALFREASAMVSYQCGVLMTATKFRLPIVGFWPVKSDENPKGWFKREFMTSWLPPWADEVGFTPFGFGDKDATPDGVFEAIRSYL